MEMIKILVIEPGEEPRVEKVENNLYSLQDIVEGYIETVTIADNVCVVCNEDGRMLGLSDNCIICDVDFVGTVFICGVDGEEFCDVPEWVCDNSDLILRFEGGSV